jgi:hypothetical protein
MRYIKTYERYLEIYDLDPNEEVVIKDEELDKVDFINKNFWNKKKFSEKLRKLRQDAFKGVAGKMKSEQDIDFDDFFAEVTFNVNLTDDENVPPSVQTVKIKIPAWQLINKIKYDANKYNL